MAVPGKVTWPELVHAELHASIQIINTQRPDITFVVTLLEGEVPPSPRNGEVRVTIYFDEDGNGYEWIIDPAPFITEYNAPALAPTTG